MMILLNRSARRASSLAMRSLSAASSAVGALAGDELLGQPLVGAEPGGLPERLLAPLLSAALVGPRLAAGLALLVLKPWRARFIRQNNAR